MSNFAVVIGAGPAGLIAADKLASNGVKVLIVDRKPSFGRKFLMAGKSGLNLTKNENLEVFVSQFYDAFQLRRVSPRMFSLPMMMSKAV